MSSNFSNKKQSKSYYDIPVLKTKIAATLTSNNTFIRYTQINYRVNLLRNSEIKTVIGFFNKGKWLTAPIVEVATQQQQVTQPETQSVISNLGTLGFYALGACAIGFALYKGFGFVKGFFTPTPIPTPSMPPKLNSFSYQAGYEKMQLILQKNSLVVQAAKQYQHSFTPEREKIPLDVQIFVSKGVAKCYNQLKSLDDLCKQALSWGKLSDHEYATLHKMLLKHMRDIYFGSQDVWVWEVMGSYLEPYKDFFL